MSQVNTLPFQPKFKVVINGDDVTRYIEGEITIEHELQQPIIANFRFLSSNDKIGSLNFQSHVQIWGGYDTENLYQSDRIIQAANSFGLIFSGVVMKKGLQANQNGMCFITVTAYDHSFSRSGVDTHLYYYPGKDITNERSWIDKDSIKTSEIVKNICDAMGKELSLAEGDLDDKVWSRKKPLYQDGISDMAFLNYLAERSGCYIWSDYKQDDCGNMKEVIHFKSKKAVVENTDVSFVYLNKYKEYPMPVFQFEKRDFKVNKLYLSDCSITIDPVTYGIPVTRITDYDFSTGEEKERFVMYDEGTNSITYYEINQDRVNALMNTPEGRKIADGLQNMGAFGIPWEIAKDYFDPVTIKSDIIDQMDSPVYGILLNATTRGSIAIRPFRRYKVSGVPMIQGELKNREAAYYLLGMTHVISSTGFFTHLQFKA